MMVFTAVQSDHHPDGLELPLKSIGCLVSLVFHLWNTVAYDNTQDPSWLLHFKEIKQMSRNPVITEPPNLPCQVKSHKEKPLEKMKQSLKDKTIVVTGAATGIGLALSRLLVSHGARLIGVGHSIARCEEASRLLLEAADNSRFVILPSELSLMSNVRDLSTKIRQHLNDCGTGKLDALVLNAAAVPFRQIRTIEGMDTQWTVNYLSGFLLSHLLIPELANAGNARLISVSSDSHYNMHMRWQNLQFDGFYHPLLAYKQSKLAQVMFTAEFNRRMKGATGITALVSDP
ncbi:MAG: SDR family NAD(P)-dependent oxidoreductase, partial [Chloroflexi bacterium]|nr:SDR family NAD(P)-dependent oxidoreductase [Chloroflexota bacterium]